MTETNSPAVAAGARAEEACPGLGERVQLIPRTDGVVHSTDRRIKLDARRDCDRRRRQAFSCGTEVGEREAAARYCFEGPLRLFCLIDERHSAGDPPDAETRV